MHISKQRLSCLWVSVSALLLLGVIAGGISCLPFKEKSNPYKLDFAQMLKLPVHIQIHGRLMGENMKHLTLGKQDAVNFLSNGYFKEMDPNKWETNYATISYPDFYPSIDFVFYRNLQQFKNEFGIASGKHAKFDSLHANGAKEVFFDLEGNLHILMDNEQQLKMQKIIVYQMLDEETTQFVDFSPPPPQIK